MPHFKTVTEQKNILRERILKNQTIVNLLVNTGDNVLEFTDVKTGGRSPAADLVKKHFFIPDTTTRDQNFITMRCRVIGAHTDVVKRMQVVLYVICNEDHIDLKQGSRADLIADALDEILNNGDDPIFGLGGIDIGTAEEVQFNTSYYGWEIPFTTREMNRRAELL